MRICSPIALVLLTLSLGPVATAHQRGSGQPPPADSVRGTLDLVYHDSSFRIDLTQASGERLTVVGHRAELVQLRELEVVVFGQRLRALPGDTGQFRAERVIARANQRRPVSDGFLRLAPGGTHLELLEGGDRPIRQLPDELRGANGARVVVLDTEGQEFFQQVDTTPARLAEMERLLLDSRRRRRDNGGRIRVLEENRRIFERMREEWLGPGMCACAARPPGTAECPPPTARDSVRGTVVVNGTSSIGIDRGVPDQIAMDGEHEVFRMLRGRTVVAFGTLVAPRCLRVHHVTVRAARVSSPAPASR